MGETMRGLVFLGDGRAEVRDFPKPTPGPGEVLVRLRCAAICGSDLRIPAPPSYLGDALFTPLETHTWENALPPKLAV